MVIRWLINLLWPSPKWKPECSWEVAAGGPRRTWEPGKKYYTGQNNVSFSPLASEFGDLNDPETKKKMDAWCKENFGG